jgi:hypothetical protein
MTMDIQTILPIIILAGGLIYETSMWIYRKIQNNETFDLGKYALTYGYVALLATSVYIITGIVPGVSDIMSQLGNSIPDVTTVLTVASALIIGVFQQFTKKPAAVTTPATIPTSAGPAVPTGGSGWQPDFSVVPTFPKIKSGQTVVFTLETVSPGTGPDTGIHRCKEIIVDWMDGSPLQVVSMGDGLIQVPHAYNYAAGTSQYDAHQFYPEFTTVDAYDGAKKSFNTDGRACAIEVVSLIPANPPGK